MILKTVISSRPLASFKAQTVAAVLSDAFPVWRNASLSRQLASIADGFKKKRLSDIQFVPSSSRSVPAETMVMHASMGSRLEPVEQVVQAVCTLVKHAASRGIRNVVVPVNALSESVIADRLLPGLCLGGYAFNKYKRKNHSQAPLTVTLWVQPGIETAVKKKARTAGRISDSVNRCRDLVNEPANMAHLDAVEAGARRIAKTHGLSIRVLYARTLEARGYLGHVTVGRGGSRPPRMIVLTYSPAKKSSGHLALVGKGIVFDSGGISLKPSSDMWLMKGDMAGAATVLHSLEALAQLKPKCKVSAILCLAENLPDAHSVRPGDIFKAKNGKTVHVENTDAEGRLVLSDGLCMAGQLKATHLVDAATLTGAVAVALGDKIGGLLSNSESFAKRIIDCGAENGEVFWPLPLHAEYRDMIDSPYADLNNIGTARQAGTITAGLFLQEFVPPGIPWAHLDIAGTAFSRSGWKYLGKGATGFGVRTLVQLARSI